MTANIDKTTLHKVIEDLPQSQIVIVYDLLSNFLNDYADMNLTQDEHAAHMQALEDDEWYD
ncbi:MAG: hypothetical protein FWB74_07700 [Defluviitaleaceae bacterium]|nr:hypothetical protein [Defluviitaleaceae bacterium]